MTFRKSFFIFFDAKIMVKSKFIHVNYSEGCVWHIVHNIFVFIRTITPSFLNNFWDNYSKSMNNVTTFDKGDKITYFIEKLISSQYRIPFHKMINTYLKLVSGFHLEFGESTTHVVFTRLCFAINTYIIFAQLFNIIINWSYSPPNSVLHFFINRWATP